MEKIILLEVRRQVAHLFCGILLALLVFLGWVDVPLLGMATLFSILLIFYWRAHREKKCFLGRIIALLERDENKEEYPGKGLFFFLLGVFLVTLLFPQKIALASIIILAVGDSLSHLYGRFLGTIKIPFYPRKNLEGHIIATLLAALAASIFLPFWPVLVAAGVSMILEIPCWHVGKFCIDDNLLIPLVAGLILTTWQNFWPFL